jgi:hypothetical protein
MVSSSTPLWAELSFEESRDVVAALARLGFVYDPAAGRGAGRVPAPVLLRERGDLDGELA